jgi:hypothetical protein
MRDCSTAIWRFTSARSCSRVSRRRRSSSSPVSPAKGLADRLVLLPEPLQATVDLLEVAEHLLPQRDEPAVEVGDACLEGREAPIEGVEPALDRLDPTLEGLGTVLEAGHALGEGVHALGERIDPAVHRVEALVDEVEQLATCSKRWSICSKRSPSNSTSCWYSVGLMRGV